MTTINVFSPPVSKTTKHRIVAINCILVPSIKKYGCPPNAPGPVGLVSGPRAVVACARRLRCPDAANRRSAPRQATHTRARHAQRITALARRTTAARHRRTYAAGARRPGIKNCTWKSSANDGHIALGCQSSAFTVYVDHTLRISRTVNVRLQCSLALTRLRLFL